MLLEGVKLMLVGMGTVILFLCLIIFLLQIVSKLTEEHTAREFEAIELERKQMAEAARAKKKRELERASSGSFIGEDEDDIAVIAAAIAAFEAESFQTSR